MPTVYLPTRANLDNNATREQVEQAAHTFPDVEQAFDEHLDATHEPVTVAGVTIKASTTLRHAAPAAYYTQRTAFIADEYTVTDTDDYRPVQDTVNA